MLVRDILTVSRLYSLLLMGKGWKVLTVSRRELMIDKRVYLLLVRGVFTISVKEQYLVVGRFFLMLLLL